MYRYAYFNLNIDITHLFLMQSNYLTFLLLLFLLLVHLRYASNFFSNDSMGNKKKVRSYDSKWYDNSIIKTWVVWFPNFEFSNGSLRYFSYFFAIFRRLGFVEYNDIL